MYLKRFVFINWGNVPATEFEMGPVNLLSGASGSGKTTAADAIQTIMTAAKNNLFNYNPGQDETTQKGRGGKQVRTLASYVLGCDDGSFARPWRCDGFLAAVFYPTQGEEAAPFTALIGVRADYDTAGKQPVAREIESRYFIVPNEQLCKQDFFRTPEQLFTLDELPARLQQRFGKRAVEEFSTKKSYLGRLYGALRGRDGSVSERESHNAARAFSRFMAYKPVGSITDFVAQEILEPRELGEAIRSVSTMMKTINGMEADARRIQQEIGRLDAAALLSERYLSEWVRCNTLRYTEAKVEYLQVQQQYLKEKQRQQALRDALEENGQQAGRVEAQQQRLQQQLIRLEARRMGNPELQRKDELQQGREQAQKQLVAEALELLSEDSLLNANLDAAVLQQQVLADKVLREQLELGGLYEQAQQLLELGGNGLDYTLLQHQDWVDMAPLESQLQQARQLQRVHGQLAAMVTGEDSPLPRLQRYSGQREEQWQRLNNQRKQLERDISNLQHTQQVRYPRAVSEALQAIREQCPEADPKVLCEFVEVVDADWQAAIEGYLGGNRFGLIVEPDYEARAIEIVRAMKGRSSAKVIQGSKAREDAARQPSPAADSIIQLMEFGHRVAQDYLMASYGSVQQVRSAEQLRHCRRGLTASGMASGNYSLWRCDLDDGELVFGKAARQRALAAKQQQLLELQQQVEVARQANERLEQLQGSLARIRPLRVADRIEAMIAHQNRVVQLESQLGGLDLKDHEGLEQELGTLRERVRECEQQLLNQREGRGRDQQQLEQVEQSLKRFADRQERLLEGVEQREADLMEVASHLPGCHPEQLLSAADQEAQGASVERLRQESEGALRELRHLCSELVQQVREHNQHCLPGDAVYLMIEGSDEPDARLFARISKIHRELELVSSKLKGNVLVEKRDRISSLKRKFDDTFIDHLCGAIHQSIADGKQVLEDLNDELRHHSFGHEQEVYEFRWQWIPEYREYWRFFEEVRQIPVGDGGSLFASELPESLKRVRDRLVAMLLDEDEGKALRELERIADYRNYRSYEIVKKIEGKADILLSQYGTGSGGQLETPAYVIRAAAITSALQFNQGTSHLRMVLVDEAFSKMDEARSRAVLEYLTQSLGLQVIFIMPSKASGPFMDMVSNQFVFAKAPTDQPARGSQLNTRVFVDRKELNRDRIKALWENHRRTIRHQASLDFMETVLAEEAAELA
ncbi:ATP-binding protein [Aestuariirhabdus litorea]|uniref:AAA family ATPase n=1 Tax=Aestuariirhabdus litorea TaxID=2528527 RepID=A0A3P3VM98_9GAMM|nr:SbcC/MukB-like Walker B domain-containing protein [Aestuariirhabdus litorea]RRJ82998.1 hypothetical protein D0544_14220 [Aestuariirhabdus litorea]RWW93157.1 hypothetical protein DZC74_14195 [Endozoicomonadaceae bacterium GTF-13]